MAQTADELARAVRRVLLKAVGSVIRVQPISIRAARMARYALSKACSQFVVHAIALATGNNRLGSIRPRELTVEPTELIGAAY